MRGGAGPLEQVLDNLLANALDVAPSGTAVRVIGRRVAGRVELTVLDAGPGMSAELRGAPSTGSGGRPARIVTGARASGSRS